MSKTHLCSSIINVSCVEDENVVTEQSVLVFNVVIVPEWPKIQKIKLECLCGFDRSYRLKSVSS